MEVGRRTKLQSPLLRQLLYPSIDSLGCKSLDEAKESFEYPKNYKHFTSWNEEKETRKSENQLEEWGWARVQLAWPAGQGSKRQESTALLGSCSVVIFRF